MGKNTKLLKMMEGCVEIGEQVGAKDKAGQETLDNKTKKSLKIKDFQCGKRDLNPHRGTPTRT